MAEVERVDDGGATDGLAQVWGQVVLSGVQGGQASQVRGGAEGWRGGGLAGWRAAQRLPSASGACPMLWPVL